jgi:hypothetical protein
MDMRYYSTSYFVVSSNFYIYAFIRHKDFIEPDSSFSFRSYLHLDFSFRYESGGLL